MYRCIADPEILLVNGNEPIEEKKKKLDNFLEFLKINKTIYSYKGYNEEITKNLDKSFNHIKSLENSETRELFELLKTIEGIKESFFEKHEIITDFSVKNFVDFLRLIEKKFSKNFIDFVLTNKKIESEFKTLKPNDTLAVLNFYKDNLNITRETGYIISNKESKTKKQGQVKNFTDFKNIVLSNLGFNDLSYCEIYIIQPDILNTLYVDQRRMKDKTNLRVFLHVIINFLADKFSNTDRKPSIG